MKKPSPFRAALLAGIAVTALAAPLALTFPVRPAAAATDVQAFSFADMVEKVKPAVVSVRVKRVQPVALDAGPGAEDDADASPLERFLRRYGQERDGYGERRRDRSGPMSVSQGSGFFISADGYAVTNNHVVQGGNEVELTTDDGRKLVAKVVGTDPRTDIALLKVDGASGLPFVALSAKPPRVGDWVLAVGNPFGLGGTVTAGIVSARGRDIGSGPYDDFLQVDAPINKGNSGGPTFNAAGEVVGVNTAIYSPSGGNVGIAFAIPASTVQQVVEQLKDKGSVSRGWIGVQIQPLTPEIAEAMGLSKTEGALVASVQPGSPAADAQLRASDIIVSVDGEATKSARDLTRRIGAMQPKQSVTLAVIRSGKTETVKLTLGTLPEQDALSPARPNSPSPRAEGRRGDDMRGNGPRGEVPGLGGPRIGLTLEPNSAGGVKVTAVDSGSLAEQLDIKVGDVITHVAGTEVKSVEDIRKAIGDARSTGKQVVVIKLKSGSETRVAAVPLLRR